MIILLSSSKTQNFTSEVQSEFQTEPEYAKRAQKMASQLAKLSIQELMQKMNLSEKLAQKTHQQFQDFSQVGYCLKKSALFAYSGTVFLPFKDAEYSKEQLWYAQKSIRIISGLYGLLCPFDSIQPYRLEMKLAAKQWKAQLTTQLKDSNQILVNLASKESLQAMNQSELGNQFIDIQFLQEKNGVTKTIPIYAKKARGEMAHWMIKHQVQKKEQITQFSELGYTFLPKQSTKKLFVFKTVI